MKILICSFCSVALGWTWAGAEPETRGPSAPLSEAQAERIWEQDYWTGDWAGTRTRLEDKGLSFHGEYTAEVLGNVSGGLRRNGAVYEGVLDVGLGLDFEKMTGWWKGGSFFVNAFWTHGPSVSRRYVGDLLTVSNKDASDTVRLFELWYQQNFFNDKVSLRLGQLAADEEFAVSEYGALFLNGTFGWPAAIAANAATPAYAVATPGIRLRVDPLPQLCLQAAVFDGAPDSFQTDGSPMNNRGTRINWNEEEGIFSIYELGYHLNQEEKAQGLKGIYKIGGWWHSDDFADSRFDSAGVPLAGSFARLDDGTGTGTLTPGLLTGTGKARADRTNWGVYGMVDQELWRESGQDGDQGLGAFFRAGGSPGNRSLIEFYTDGGLSYKGAISGRDNDRVGVGVAFGQIGQGVRRAQRDANEASNGNTFLTGGVLGDNNGDGFVNANDLNQRVPDYEMVVEATYLVQLTPWWYVQPDFQYVFHPGGSAQLQDAVVIGARTGLVF